MKGGQVKAVAAMVVVAAAGAVWWMSSSDPEPPAAPKPRPTADTPRDAPAVSPSMVAPRGAPSPTGTSRLRSEEDYGERMIDAEEDLEAQGTEARRQLIDKQVRRLDLAIKRAEQEGNPERARLMRARIKALEAKRAQLPADGE